MSSPKSSNMNLFQQVMALWEDEHPYNAGHMVRLRGQADVAALQAAIQTACQLAGVGKLVLDRERKRYQYEPAESIDLSEIQSGDSAVETLCRTVTEQINTPFPDEPHHPVRWLVLDDLKTDSHFLVAIYRHLAADSVSMRLLIRRVLNRYSRTPEPGEEQPLNVHPPDYTRVMRHHYRRLGYLTTLVDATQLYLRLRHAHRMSEREGGAEGSRFHLFDAPEGLIGCLAGACRLRGVSVNDAFLAALCGAIAEITPLRCHHPRRRALALSTAVDVRGEASEDLSNCFGLYLGQSVTIIDEADAADFGQLLAGIAEQTRVEKAEKRFVGPEWNFLIIAILRGRFSLKSTRTWYRKVYPISGAVSNVKLGAPWFTGASERILDYIRISPTGPALPLVLTPTTFGDKLNLSLVYHQASLTCAEARRLIELFLDRLERFASAGTHHRCGGV